MKGDTQRRTTSEIAQLAAAAGQLAIDTEFVSERRYRTLLCLVQVAVPDPSAPGGVRCAALDPLAGFDREPLARVLADPAVEVVMHAGRQDVALLRRELATDIHNLFDTQVAAGFAGFSAQEGYQTLVRQLVGVRIEGGEGFTRWDQRPLTEAQLRYALDDVRYLLALAEELKRRLEQLGRLEWAREESRAIEEISDARDPLQIVRRLPRAGRLSGEQRAVALGLVEWREQRAAQLDRPPATVLADHVLVELARRRPRTRSELRAVRGLDGHVSGRTAEELLAVVERSRHREPPPAPPQPPQRDASEQPIASLAQALVRQRAREAGIATELVATQSELQAFVAAVRRGDAPTGRLAAGWRHELVGRELVQLVKGKLALSAGSDGLRVIEVAPLAREQGTQ